MSDAEQKTGATPFQEILARSRRPGLNKVWLLGGGALVVVLLALWLGRSGGENAGIRFITEEVGKGNLLVTVSATGNLYPTNQVDIGSELSGTIEKVLVDENDRVKKGQILASLDLSKLTDQVNKSQAAVVAAEAQVAQMRATVKESQANLARLRKVAELSGGKVPSKAELDTAEAALLRAEANEVNAQAAVAQAQATLKSDRTNLGKATIKSPIDGIVLIRKVEPGQTVAASLQAPVLFTIAEDLSKMELRVDVDEADVSQVHPGQTAGFSVDAWPGRAFPATIERVGFGSQTKDGVVSYKAILQVSNQDLSLRPGMTATAEIQTAKHDNVILIPNAALRFTPPVQNASNGGLLSKILPSGPRRQPKKVKNNGSEQQVWVLRENKPAAVPVKVGLSNGRYTEVLGGELQPGMQVITDMQNKPK